MKKNLIFLTFFLTSNYVIADEQKCLWRAEPGGKYDNIYVQNYQAPTASNPISGTIPAAIPAAITIMEPLNKYCPEKSECAVSKYDTVKLDGLNLTWRKISDNSEQTFTMDEIKIKDTDSKIFLQGRDETKKWSVFLIYNGQDICHKDMPVSPSASCGWYRFEIHPDGVGGFIKPTHPVAETSKIDWWACVIPRQPGGGNGNDPP